MLTRKLIIAACFLIALFILPYFLTSFMVFVFIRIFIYIILASSLRLSLITGHLNFGVPAFMALGAYSSALLMMRLECPFLISFFAAGLIAAAVGLIIGLPSLRLKGVYLLIITWGFVEVIRASAIKWRSLTGGAIGLSRIPFASIFNMVIDTKLSQYHFVLIVTLLILIILYRLEKSRFGLILQGIRQAEGLSKSVGINTYAYEIIALVISSFFCGLAGSAFAHNIGFVTPGIFSFWLATMMVVSCFVGGLSDFTGPIIGTVFMFLLTESLRGFGHLEAIIYGLVMIFVVLFLPNGLVGILPQLITYTDKVKTTVLKKMLTDQNN